ncbi:MAG: hypothetical protein WD379_08940 [Dehalococcoidia bacterium]
MKKRKRPFTEAAREFLAAMFGPDAARGLLEAAEKVDEETGFRTGFKQDGEKAWAGSPVASYLSDLAAGHVVGGLKQRR